MPGMYHGGDTYELAGFLRCGVGEEDNIIDWQQCESGDKD